MTKSIRAGWWFASFAVAITPVCACARTVVSVCWGFRWIRLYRERETSKPFSSVVRYARARNESTSSIVSSQFSSGTFVILHPCSSHNLPNYMTRVLHHGFLSHFPSSLLLSSPLSSSSSLSLIKSSFAASSLLFTIVSAVSTPKHLQLIFIRASSPVFIFTRPSLGSSARSPDSFALLVPFVGTSLSSRSNPIWDTVQSSIFDSPWTRQMVNMTRECCTILE